jgi:phosphatidylserine/phosphatidylglycerophosphate/cardiolipin synthase-like enzyme
VLTTTRAKGGRKRLKKLATALAATGATVHAYADPVVKYHAKYLVADNGPALIATLNFTRKCFTRTWDALVVTYDPDVVSGLRQLMAADRDGGPLPESLSPRLIVGPERARRQLLSIIERAESRIRLIDAKLSDPELAVLLQARRESGVDVEIIGSKRLGDLKSHGKIMLVDNRIAVVGSLALAALSLDFRREVAIIVDDPAAVADINQLFETIGAVVGSAPIAGETTGVAPC